MATQKMFKATLTGISEIEVHRTLNEHVDAGTWEAFASSAAVAKNMLVHALENRLVGAEQQLSRAKQLLRKAEALKIPDAHA